MCCAAFERECVISVILEMSNIEFLIISMVAHMFYRLEEDGSVNAETKNGDDHGIVEDAKTLKAKVRVS